MNDEREGAGERPHTSPAVGGASPFAMEELPRGRTAPGSSEQSRRPESRGLGALPLDAQLGGGGSWVAPGFTEELRSQQSWAEFGWGMSRSASMSACSAPGSGGRKRHTAVRIPSGSLIAAGLSDLNSCSCMW